MIALEKKKQKSKLTFEEALLELEEITGKLERGDLGLEDSISEFERGIILARFCHSRLEEAEKKIELLQKNENGSIVKKDLSVRDESGDIDDDEVQGTLL